MRQPADVHVIRSDVGSGFVISINGDGSDTICKLMIMAAIYMETPA